MKHLITLSVTTSLLLSASAYAVNPAQGFYLGLFGEMSSGPSGHTQVYELKTTPTQVYVFSGRSNFSRIGGGGLGVLGYRYNQFRIEAEGLYNWIGAGTFTYNDCTLQSPTVQTPTPTDICKNSVLGQLALDNKAGFNGSISGIYGLVNVFYDIVDYDSDWSAFPYIGAGIGYLSLKNQVNFVATVIPQPNQPSAGASSIFKNTAAQIILGLGYFMDDFTWGGIDYRYITSNTLRDFGNKRFAIHTINFGVNLSFDKSST